MDDSSDNGDKRDPGGWSLRELIGMTLIVSEVVTNIILIIIQLNLF